MKFLVTLFLIAASAATISPTCLYCSQNKNDHQEITFGELRSLENFIDDQYLSTVSKNVTEKFRIIQKLVQKYPLFAEEAKQKAQYSDPLNVVDATEFLDNGVIEYRNASIFGLANSILKDVKLNQIAKNLFSMYATIENVEIAGDFVVANSDQRQYGHFYIMLKNVNFNAQFQLDKFLEIQPEINATTITFSDHEAVYSNEDILNELTDQNTGVQKPYSYYFSYVNDVIKDRLAKEMTIKFKPLIARRFEQILTQAILFPTKEMQMPNSNVNVDPEIQAHIYNNMLYDLKRNDKIQKMIDYTVNQDATDLLFAFTSYDLRGTTNWALEFYSTGNTYQGEATYAVDNMQTIIVVSQPNNGQGQIAIKFAKTVVNGLTVMLNVDKNCESIKNFAHQRIPYVLEQSLEKFFNEQSKEVLNYQITLIGEKNQY